MQGQEEDVAGAMVPELNEYGVWDAYTWISIHEAVGSLLEEILQLDVHVPLRDLASLHHAVENELAVKLAERRLRRQCALSKHRREDRENRDQRGDQDVEGSQEGKAHEPGGGNQAREG